MFKIIKDLYSDSVCVLGWTPQTIRTIFFCKTYSQCRWIEAAVPQTWIPYEIWGSISALYKLSNVSDSNDLRAFMIKPIPLAIFRDMHLIWSIQFNLWPLFPKILHKLLDFSFTYMNSQTNLIFTSRSEYHKICFLDVEGKLVGI